ncbi:MAG: hypothetical protein NZL93_05070, partial [Chthoniobacterales bacterium]|nr:hypothetical protein [Chthoniobacterales bacterium]
MQSSSLTSTPSTHYSRPRSFRFIERLSSHKPIPPLSWIVASSLAIPISRVKNILWHGPWVLAKALAESLPQVNFCFLTSSSRLPKAIQSWLEKRQPSNFETFTGWSWANSVPENLRNCYDLVISLHGFSYPSPHGILQALANFLRPNGGALFIRFATKLSTFFFNPPETPSAPSHELLNLSAKLSSLSPALSGWSGLTEKLKPILSRFPLPENGFELLRAAENAGLMAIADPRLPAYLLPSAGNLPLETLRLPSLSDLAKAYALLYPAPFFDMLIVKGGPGEPPWNAPSALQLWKPWVPFFNTSALPSFKPPWLRPVHLTLEIQGILPKVTIQVSSVVAAILREANGNL